MSQADPPNIDLFLAWVRRRYTREQIASMAGAKVGDRWLCGKVVEGVWFPAPDPFARVRRVMQASGWSNAKSSPFQ